MPGYSDKQKIKEYRLAGMSYSEIAALYNVSRQRIHELEHSEPATPQHRMSGTPEYNSYKGAQRRCSNPKDKAYHWYGARGIEFRFKTFDEFYQHIGSRPAIGYSLDRIDNDGKQAPIIGLFLRSSPSYIPYLVMSEAVYNSTDAMYDPIELAQRQAEMKARMRGNQTQAQIKTYYASLLAAKSPQIYTYKPIIE
jgi:transcriptional regulator with XRE-family HTH domain